MTKLLMKLFLPQNAAPDDPEVRRRCGSLSGGVGIGLNLLLSLGKLLSGLLTGSVAMVADGLNNLSDAATSVVTLVGFHLAGQKADREHPFGHGRMEYVTGLIVALAVLLMGFEVGRSAVEQIFVPEENQAKELKNKLDNGEDFESLAANYSKASQTTITIARGDKDQTYEDVAFNLGNDEISDVFADNNGYYILKCLNTYMESESEANKEKVARQRKTERFHAIYSDLMEDTISEFQQRMWDNIKFTDYDTVTTSNFFEVYQEYFG